eukprot:Pgem_evm2s10382
MGVVDIKEALTLKALRAGIAEFCGMFLFLFITIGVVCSTRVNITPSAAGGAAADEAANTLTIALAFGISIMVLAYTTAFDSNQFNPAVTVALMVFGKLNVFCGLINIVMQVIGSIVGVAMVKAIWPNTTHNFYGLNAISGDMTLAGAFFAEFFGTAILCYVVAGVAVDKRNSQHSPINAAIAIGFAVFLAHLLLIPITGCGINPARTIGSAAIAGVGKDLWVYILAPLVGGVFGFGVHHFGYQFKNGSEEANTKGSEDVSNFEHSSSDIKV